MNNNNKLGLNQELCKQLLDSILSYKKVEKVVIYGSRARDNFTKTSDIDIAIFANDWTDKDINLTKDLLEENIKTPLKIDLVNFYAITKETLKENILNNGITIYESK